MGAQEENIDRFDGVCHDVSVGVLMKLTASQALAAVVSEIAQQLIHVAKRCTVDEVATLPFLTYQTCMGEFFEVEGQRIARGFQLFCQVAGRKAAIARHDERTEDSQSHFLR